MKSHKSLCLSFIALLVLLPATTYGQVSNSQWSGDINVVVDGQQNAAHFERNGKLLRVEISSADGDTASFLLNGSVVTLGDGTVIRNTFSPTAEEMLVRVEFGNLVSINHFNLRTGQGFVTGDASAIGAALRASHDVQVLKKVLPALAARVTGQPDREGHRITPNALTPAPETFWGCTGALLTMVAADIGVIIGCATPEPAEPLVCAMALFAWAGAAANVFDQCY